MDDELAMSRLDTVEMLAAIGPMMATLASHGGKLSTMAEGMMLSTLPP